MASFMWVIMFMITTTGRYYRLKLSTKNQISDNIVLNGSFYGTERFWDYLVTLENETSV